MYYFTGNAMKTKWKFQNISKKACFKFVPQPPLGWPGVFVRPTIIARWNKFIDNSKQKIYCQLLFCVGHSRFTPSGASNQFIFSFVVFVYELQDDISRDRGTFFEILNLSPTTPILECGCEANPQKLYQKVL